MARRPARRSEKNLEDSERALQEYREQARIIETQGLAQSGATQPYRRPHDQHWSRRGSDDMRPSTHTSRSRTAKDQPDILPVVMRNPMWAQLKEAEREAAEARRGACAALRAGASADDPGTGRAQEGARQPTRQIDTVVASLRNEYELARERKGARAQPRRSQRRKSRASTARNSSSASLERAVATNRQIYDLFLNRFKETQASREVDTNAVARVTDEARPSQYPIKPKKEQAVSIAFVLGLLAGALIALLLERLDNTLKSADDVEEKLEQPMLTMLPLLQREKRNPSAGITSKIRNRFFRRPYAPPAPASCFLRAIRRS